MVDIPTFDVFSRETRQNPQVVYEQMRRVEPVYRAIGPITGNTFWFLTRYEDCAAMLKDPRVGKEIQKHLPPELLANFPQPPEPLRTIDRHLLNLDPPDHTRLRSLIHKAFTPHIVENLRPRIQQIADDLLDAVAGQDTMDLIGAFAFPLPITVIAELLGVPLEDREKFRRWTKSLLFGPTQEDAMRAGMEFVMYMNALADTRSADPRADLLTALVNAEEEGSRLDRQELMSMLFLLLVAGHETTVNLIGNGVLALLQHPEQLQMLRNDRSLIRSAIDEMLRYNGPVETTTFRWAFEDIQIDGKIIRQGDVILAALLAANRDPAQFEHPDTFDIRREPNKHIAFGHGIHYCVGAPLARLEGAVAINTLLQRLPGLRLAPGAEETLEWSDSILLHGMKTLPLVF